MQEMTNQADWAQASSFAITVGVAPPFDPLFWNLGDFDHVIEVQPDQLESDEAVRHVVEPHSRPEICDQHERKISQDERRLVLLRGKNAETLNASIDPKLEHEPPTHLEAPHIGIIPMSQRPPRDAPFHEPLDRLRRVVIVRGHERDEFGGYGRDGDPFDPVRRPLPKSLVRIGYVEMQDGPRIEEQDGQGTPQDHERAPTVRLRHEAELGFSEAGDVH